MFLCLFARIISTASRDPLPPLLNLHSPKQLSTQQKLTQNETLKSRNKQSLLDPNGATYLCGRSTPNGIWPGPVGLCTNVCPSPYCGLDSQDAQVTRTTLEDAYFIGINTHNHSSINAPALSAHVQPMLGASSATSQSSLLIYGRHGFRTWGA